MKPIKKGKLALIALLGVWAGGGAVVIACSSSDATSTTTADAGIDSAKTATPTATVTATGTTPPVDSGAPDSGDDDVDSGDLDAGGHAIWAFNAYCPDDAADDAGCNVFDNCPGFDGGGIATQQCDTPFKRCLSKSPADSGVHDRQFVCEPTVSAVWDLNRICNYEPCDSVDAAACDSFDGGGIAGQTCATPQARCISNDARIFICQPNTGLVEVFNGYCDAGSGVTACNADAGICPGTDGGVAASPCTTNLERCLVQANDLDAGAKIFVCGDRSQ